MRGNKRQSTSASLVAGGRFSVRPTVIRRATEGRLLFRQQQPGLRSFHICVSILFAKIDTVSLAFNWVRAGQVSRSSPQHGDRPQSKSRICSNSTARRKMRGFFSRVEGGAATCAGLDRNGHRALLGYSRTRSASRERPRQVRASEHRGRSYYAIQRTAYGLRVHRRKWTFRSI
jgi:hypothetical protein